MSSQSETAQESPTMTGPRPMYWSVRREIWENRSIYLAPFIVAAVVLFASSLGLFGLPKRMRTASTLAPEQRHARIVSHYNMAPAPIMLTAFLVGMFYALDALYGERRDRSILFWKSLPVSDRTAVLSKASIPLAVLPVIALVLSVITQFILLFLSTLVLIVNRINPAPLWIEMQFFSGVLIMVYGLIVHTLWFAPIYGWFMLVSAWARRMTFLWAILPPLAIAMVERIALNSKYFAYMLQYRITGAMKEAFIKRRPADELLDRLSQLDPVRFLNAPGLWVGLAFAALFFALAVRLRRNREPI